MVLANNVFPSCVTSIGRFIQARDVDIIQFSLKHKKPHWITSEARYLLMEKQAGRPVGLPLAFYNDRSPCLFMMFSLLFSNHPTSLFSGLSFFLNKSQGQYSAQRCAIIIVGLLMTISLLINMSFDKLNPNNYQSGIILQLLKI